MIRYDLKCAKGHGFDSWFASASAYDRLAASQLVACPSCGSTEVEKALMAPMVAIREAERPLTTPRDTTEESLAALRRKIEETSEYVGQGFVDQARAMHEGRSPERAIHGEAKLQEAIALVEEGIPVIPLPFAPSRKTN